MDKFKELEKYKLLYDDGALTEQEFKKIKQQLLGLKTDEDKEQERLKQREEVLAELERLRNNELEKSDISQDTQDNKEQKKQDVQKDKTINEKVHLSDEELFDRMYIETKAREKAQLDVLKEEKENKRKKNKENITNVYRNLKNIVFNALWWCCSIILLILMLGCFLSVKESGILDLIMGILFLIMSIYVCPLIRKKIENNDKFKWLYRYIRYIVPGYILLIFILIIILGSK